MRHVMSKQRMDCRRHRRPSMSRKLRKMSQGERERDRKSLLSMYCCIDFFVSSACELIDYDQHGSMTHDAVYTRSLSAMYFILASALSPHNSSCLFKFLTYRTDKSTYAHIPFILIFWLILVLSLRSNERSPLKMNRVWFE